MIIEYLYCLIYVISLFICIYPYLDYVNNIIYTTIFLILYGAINLIITGDYIIHFKTFILTNLLVIVSDYMMIALYNRKKSLYLLFYTSLYLCIYAALVNFVTYLCLYIGITTEAIYLNDLLRFILVFVYNIGSIVIFKLLSKVKVVPLKTTVKEYCFIFIGLNMLIGFVFIIFFGLSIVRIENHFILFVFLMFCVLWLSFLYLLNYSIVLISHNKSLSLLHLSYQDIEYMMSHFENENNKMQKIKHDIKNHLHIIKELNSTEEIKAYINNIYTDLNSIDTIQKITGNSTLDILFAIKEQQYPNIHFSYNIDICNVDVNIKDLCSILFNLIDNASQNVSRTNTKVYIQLIQQFNDLIITVSNSFDKNFTLSQKKGKEHGYGLQIVEEVVHKYNGNMNIEVQNDIVIVQIILDTSKKEKENNYGII